jgi:hypothetical protein
MKPLRPLFAMLILALLVPADAGAIPAFARRHKLSCSTCHAPFPRLKAYGDEFAGNGFVIPEQEKERDYVAAGDDLLWLSRDFPLAARFEAFGVYTEDAEVESDLQSPWGLKLLSGGALGRGIGYYFYFYMSERGEVAGVEDAYIHFNDIGGRPLDVMVGQFQTCDPLMKRELRLTFEDYLIYKLKVGDSGTNLAYDRGLIFTYGIEATGTDLVAMLVNGNGKPEAGEDGFDDDNYKNVGLRLKQGIGDALAVGGFAYLGKERLLPEGATAKEDNEIRYLGPDLTLAVGPAAITAQYLLRLDSNPAFLDVAPAEDVETAGWVAELVLSPSGDLGRHFFTLLYNRIDSDLEAHDYETATAGATYLIARNLRISAEYTRDLEAERSRVVVGLTAGF